MKRKFIAIKKKEFSGKKTILRVYRVIPRGSLKFISKEKALDAFMIC
jgi:hypothetical protein